MCASVFFPLPVLRPMPKLIRNMLVFRQLSQLKFVEFNSRFFFVSLAYSEMSVRMLIFVFLALSSVRAASCQQATLRTLKTYGDTVMCTNRPRGLPMMRMEPGEVWTSHLHNQSLQMSNRLAKT